MVVYLGLSGLAWVEMTEIILKGYKTQRRSLAAEFHAGMQPPPKYSKCRH